MITKTRVARPTDGKTKPIYKLPIKNLPLINWSVAKHTKDTEWGIITHERWCELMIEYFLKEIWTKCRIEHGIINNQKQCCVNVGRRKKVAK